MSFKDFRRQKKSDEIFKLFRKHNGVVSKTCTQKTFEENPEYNWDWPTLQINKNIRQFVPNFRTSFNPNLTIDFVIAHPNCNWSWEYLSRTIDYKIIQAHPELPWRLKDILINKSVTFEIAKTLYEDCFGEFSNNANLTWDIFEENINKRWNVSAISSHKCVTWEIIKNNPQINWDWKNVLRNPNITWDIIKNELRMYWENACGSEMYIMNIFTNPNITLEIIKSDPILSRNLNPWCVIHLSVNRNINLKTILDNPEINFTWTYVRTKLGEEFSTRVKREWLAILRIQRWWKTFY